MKLLVSIKNIFSIIWKWILHFFRENRGVKKKKIVKQQVNQKIKKDFKASINRDETISNTVITLYPGVYPKELESINKKIEVIKKKVQEFNDENIQEELNNIEKISQIIDNNQILVNQIDNLNEIFDKTIFDENLNINTNEKINILKESITNLFEENLKDYEEHIIKRAYYEHEKVNYVIVTSMLIDELHDELEKVHHNYQKNRYSKKEFIDKVKEIERKLERLEKINNKKEVQREIKILKNDLYTKQKDKYDLLYNSEIFINFEKQCKDIIKQVEINEKKEKEVKILEKQVEVNETEKVIQKEEKKKELEKEKKKLEEEKLREENILKRFMDLELARQILGIREASKLKKIKNENVVTETLDSYQEFLTGDSHEFNFVRNKIKLEVTKLYNDTLRNICILEETSFVPMEHINVKLSDIVEETLNNQQRLNYLLAEKKKVKIEETEVSIKVTEKLTNVLQKEQEREMVKEKSKVLVKTYQHPQNKEENKNKELEL